MKTNRLSVNFLILLAAMAVIGFAFNTPREPAGGEFKNLKVLPKNISKEKLDSVMFHFSMSLGVRCGFCHAASADTTKKHLDFASDTKMEKEIARKMMHMTTTINSVYFNFNNSKQADTISMVTCYTCHRGKQEPSAQNLAPEIQQIKDSFKKKK